MSEGKNLLSKIWFPYFFLASIIFLLYAHVLYYDFVYCDDHILVLDQKNFLSHFSNAAQAFKQDAWNNGGNAYRPLVTLSFILDSQFGNSSFAYHLSNIFIHIISSSLVFILLLQIKCKKEIALLLSVLFTVHPVMISSVGWISGRMDSLLGIFIIGSFILLLKFLETTQKKYFLLHALLFLCALLTKESAVAFPFVCILYTAFIIRKKISSIIFLFGGWIISVLVWFILRSSAINKSSSENFSELIKTFFSNLPALIQQTGKIFLPFNLATMPVVEDTTFIFGIISLGILAFLFYKTKNKSLFAFGILWFVIFLLPTYTVTVSGARMHTDNRLYVPAMGIIFALSQINFKSKELFIFIPLILIFSFLNFQFAKKYENRFSFYEDAALHSPHCALAQKGLGDNDFLQGDFANSEEQYRKTLLLNSSLEGVHMNLGLIAMKKNLFEKAAEEFNAELKINPSSDKAYYNLALLYFQLGKISEAESLFKKTLELNSENWKADFQLGYIYAKQGRFPEAKIYLQNTLQINPSCSDAKKLLSMIEKQIK